VAIDDRPAAGEKDDAAILAALEVLKPPLADGDGGAVRVIGEAVEVEVAEVVELHEGRQAVDIVFASGGDLEPIRGLANKLPGHAARIVAVLAMLGDIDTSEVAPEAMECGIQLAQHFAVEGVRLYGASRVRAELRLAQTLLCWLRARDELVVSLPCIYQRGPGAIRDKARAEKLAGLLEDHGYLARIDGGAEIEGKWRRDVWRVIRE
jgi:hypothetical protein